MLSIYQHAATFEDARSVGSRISTSALVKTALYGEDAKCGTSFSQFPWLTSLSLQLGSAASGNWLCTAIKATWPSTGHSFLCFLWWDRYTTCSFKWRTCRCGWATCEESPAKWRVWDIHRPRYGRSRSNILYLWSKLCELILYFGKHRSSTLKEYVRINGDYRS